MNRNNIIAIGIVCMSLVLGVAVFMIASRTGSQIPVAPTAPASQPKASELIEEIVVTGYNTSCSGVELTTDANTLGLWHMDEATGNLQDSSGKNNTGIPTGTATIKAMVSNGRTIDAKAGSGIKTTSEISGNSNLTIEAWAMVPSSATTGLGILAQTQDAGLEYNAQSSTFNIRIFKNRDGAALKDTDSGNGAATQYLYSVHIVIPRDLWVHYALVVNSDNTAKLYLNGNEMSIGTRTTDGGVTGVYKTALGALRKNDESLSDVWNGAIDELRISKIARTAAEIKADAAVACWTGSESCTATGSAIAQCVPTGVITCDPDCPTACGTAASTITTCKDSCGAAKTKSCAATAACMSLTCTSGSSFSDNFGGSSIDAAKWTVNQGSGRTLSETDGKLTLSADTSADSASSVGLRSKNLLRGDFDASIDIDSLTATTSQDKNGSIQMKILDDNNTSATGVGVYRANGNELYAKMYNKTKDGQTASLANYALSNASTKIYLQRRGNEMEAFVNDGGKKVSLGKQTSDLTSPFRLEVLNWRTEGVPVTAVVDNLVLTCPVATTPDIKIEKKAYLDEDTNTAGNYTLNTTINTVAKDQTFVYVINLENTGDGDASNVTISDTLTGQKQNRLTFVDNDSGCVYTAATKKLSCTGISLAAGSKTHKSFRVKVSSDAVNGEVIKNIGKVTYGTTNKQAEKDLTVSTVLGCNHTCTKDEECSGGFVCDTTSNKCRNTACLTASSCLCPTATIAPTPTLAKCNKACNVDTDCVAGLVCDPATSLCRKEACATATSCVCPTATATPMEEATALPETGILDMPGVAAFGGGLLMAVVGILLAL